MAVLSDDSGYPYSQLQPNVAGRQPLIEAAEALQGQVRQAYIPLLAVCQRRENFKNAQLLAKLDQVICLLLVKLDDIRDVAASLDYEGAPIAREAGQLISQTQALLDLVHVKQNMAADGPALADLSMQPNTERDNELVFQGLQELSYAENLLAQVNIAAVKKRLAADQIMRNVATASPSLSDRVSERMEDRNMSDSAILSSAGRDTRIVLGKFRP